MDLYRNKSVHEEISVVMGECSFNYDSWQQCLVLALACLQCTVFSGPEAKPSYMHAGCLDC